MRRFHPACELEMCVMLYIVCLYYVVVAPPGCYLGGEVIKQPLGAWQVKLLPQVRQALWYSCMATFFTNVRTLRNVVREKKRDYVGKIPKLRGGG